MPFVFSYGSLQQEGVQLATFGRLLAGRPDGLVGFELATLQRGDKQLTNVIASRGADSVVQGTLYELTDAELAVADEYERADAYARTPVALASGTLGWVYTALPMDITGSCHCGNVKFSLRWPGDPGEIAARSCGCTFCVKHGGVWTSNPGAVLRARVADPKALARYAFGTETASFLVCARCGVAPLVTSEIEGRLYAVVNVNAFDDFDRARLRVAPASFDAEDLESRLARRRRNWIADVSLSEGEA